MNTSSSTFPRGDIAARIAAHRFGLGEARLATVGADAPGWLLAQIGPADPQIGSDLASASVGLRRFAEFQQARRNAAASAGGADLRSAEQQFGEHFRALVQADVRARMTTAALTTRPFAERIAQFWSNHFTVSMAKASARGLVGAFEREAIRPNIAGRFEDLLVAAVMHAGMLRYLDNDQSAGPDSRLARRARARAASAPEMAAPRTTGLNENLAREVLELHTLGVSGGGSAYGGWGGYTQADVTAFARVLTGWRVPVRELLAREELSKDSPTRFEEAWHEPGPKPLLGKVYPEGPQALDQVLHDLSRHPSTARFVAYKLSRHFVADEPSPALVERLTRTFLVNDGHLPALYRELVASPEAWVSETTKLKAPDEFVLSTVRLLDLGAPAFARQPDGGVAALGQRIQAAPSPAGWPDRADEWLGPDAVWKRVEWATRVAERTSRGVDARALARSSFGSTLSEATARQLDRAADGTQAMALLLLSPEFQRR